MANINLKNIEIIALGNEVLKNYCKTLNQELKFFKEKLTGNLKNYEIISDVITEHLSNDKNILNYLDSIEESLVKITLKKWITEKINAKSKISIGPWVSPNNLRKLIFYGPKEQEASFKELFIFGCYTYANIDRNNITKDLLPDNQITGKTLGLNEFVPSLKTIKPYNVNEHKTCNLTALDKKKGEHLKLNFEYAGEPFLLKRANLDRNNNTITSKIQASLYVNDGEWFLENQSELQTTFIQVTKPTKLKKGDVIVFGNKYFLFDG